MPSAGGYVVVGPASLVTTPKGLQRVRLSASGTVLSNTTSTSGAIAVRDAAVLPDGGYVVLTIGSSKALKVVWYDADGKFGASTEVDPGVTTSYGAIAAFQDGSVGVAAADDGSFGYVHVPVQGAPGPVTSGSASSVHGRAARPDGGAVLDGDDASGLGLAVRIAAGGGVSWSKSATWKGRFVRAAVRADGSIVLSGVDTGASGWDTLVLRVDWWRQSSWVFAGAGGHAGKQEDA